MSETERTKYGELAGRLKYFLAAWRINAALQGMAAAAVLFGLPVLVGIAGGAHGAWRFALLAVAAALGGTVALARFVWPLLRPFDLLDAAFLAEKKTPRLAGRVASAVELWRAASGEDYRFDKSYLVALSAGLLTLKGLSGS